MLGSGRARVSDDASSSRRRRASWPAPPVSLLVVGLAATLVVGAAQPFSSTVLVADATEAPAELVFTQAPGGSDPGEVFALQPEVEVLDADGVKVSTGADAVTLTLVHGDLLQGTLTCEDTSLTSATGEIAYADCEVDHGGTYRSARHSATWSSTAARSSSAVRRTSASRRHRPRSRRATPSRQRRRCRWSTGTAPP